MFAKISKSTSKTDFFILTILIVFVALVTGFKLNTNPPSLNWDEASLAYNAYSILHTGADEWGVKLPLIFKAFGDYKLPLYVYLDTIPVLIWGLTPFAARFVSFLAGIMAIWGMYLLTNEFYKTRLELYKISLSPGIISATLFSLLPWHFFMSRIALEANLALTLLIFGIYALIKAINNKQYYVWSSLLLGLSLHTYNTSRVFVPLIIIAFLLLYRRHIKISRHFFVGIIVLSVAFGIIIAEVFNGSGTARFQKLNILSTNAVYQIGQSRLQSKLPPLINKFIYNRPVYLTTTIIKNYLSYFSPDFLYQTWGAQAQFAIPGANLLGLPITLLFLVGIIVIAKNFRDKHSRFIIWLLLLSPVAAALTVDPPQALRPNPMMISACITAGLGFTTIVKLFSQAKIRLTVALIIVVTTFFGFLKYQYIYWHYYRETYSQSWQYGYQTVFEYLNSHKDSQKVFITKRYGEPHIFYAFYTHLDPQVLQSNDQTIRFQKSDWFWTDKIGQVYFVNDWDIPKTSISSLRLESGGRIETQGALLVTSPEHVPVNAHVEQTINFLDGSPAFVIAKLQ